MEDVFTSELVQRSVMIMVTLAAPMLLAGLVTGLGVSLFQAVTQINEQTLAFIPKIMVILLVLVITAPWMADQLTTFTQELILSIPKWVKR